MFEVISNLPYSVAIEADNPFKKDFDAEYNVVPISPSSTLVEEKWIILPKEFLIIKGKKNLIKLILALMFMSIFFLYFSFFHLSIIHFFYKLKNLIE